MKQKQALDVMKLGHNVFLTGEPGSGKTHTLNRFISYCKKHDIGIGVTASTGIAATHISGMTIHSWSGIGLNDELAPRQLEQLRTRAQLKSRFKRTRVLIIDEISMLDGKRLDLINEVCRAFKNSEKPFGGLQVILCGDLFQLPPVTKFGNDIDFAHNSRAWQELDLKICYLSEQHRQDDDRVMLELLRQIRTNSVDESTYDALEDRAQYQASDPDISRLFSHNVDVDSLNERRLGELDAEEKLFTMTSDGSKKFVEQLTKSCLAPELLRLKIGAQVICVANNQSEGFVNGSRAEVVDFDLGRPVIRLHGGRKITLEKHTWKIEDHQRVLAEVHQYPLRLAWAITVHKSQGMSLDSAEIDLSRAFAPGMGYVALSRLRSLEGLYLRGINQTALHIHPVVSAFDERLKQQSQKVVDSLSSIKTKQLKTMHGRIRDNLSSDYPDYDKDLFATLRSWRSEQAKTHSLPAYMVLDDKTLIALSAERPTHPEHLEKVPGIGPKKSEQYGDDVLRLINQHAGKLF